LRIARRPSCLLKHSIERRSGGCWKHSIEGFCQEAEVPYQTLRSWGKKDQSTPYTRHHGRPCSDMPSTASEDFRQIVEDCAAWEGSLREFFKYESARMHLSPSSIRRVLVICGMLPVKSQKGPRYRGSTAQCEPGNVLVTDGKEVKVIFTGTGEVGSYNWQGIVDQSTACHTAVVLTDTECEAGVRDAFDESCDFLGRSPQGLLHDNKPIHSDQNLRDHVEQTTLMIPATLNRPENKAVIEGEFGKFEQAVSTIYLNDESEEALKKSAVHEIIRAYTSGINHAGRVEFDGKSRRQVLQETCPNPLRLRIRQRGLGFSAVLLPNLGNQLFQTGDLMFLSAIPAREERIIMKQGLR